jgi:hypothetical protein
MTEESTAITVDQTTSAPNPDITILQHYVRAGVILQVIGLVVTLPPLLRSRKTGQPIQAIAISAFASLILWKIAHFRNWARRWFILAAVIRIVYAVPQTVFWMAMMRALLKPSEVTTTIAVVGASGFLYSIAFTLFLFRPRVRSLFIAKAPDRALALVLLGLAAVIAFWVGVFIADVERKALRSVATPELDRARHLLQ